MTTTKERKPRVRRWKEGDKPLDPKKHYIVPGTDIVERYETWQKWEPQWGEHLEEAIRRDEGELRPYELAEHKGVLTVRPNYGVEKYGFTAWTEARVYFPVKYDGKYGVMSVSRTPVDEPTPAYRATRRATGADED